MTPTIAGYELLDVLGRGAAGVVYRARDVAVGREVALKLLFAVENERALRRFQREAEALAKLDHPNLIRVHASGFSGNQPYYAMELIEGRTLEQRLGDGPLPPREAVALARAVADALACVHAAGLLHRDVKPSNILLDAEGRPRLTDFGLVKQLGSTSSLTRTGAMHGTPGYWSPEQARGKLDELSPASDVYALGATLYASLTGGPPFDPRELSINEILVATTSRPPSRPSQENPAVDRALDGVILRCLAKAPAERFPDGAALRDELARWEAGELKPPARAARAAWGVALLVLGGAAAALAFGRSTAPPPSPEATPSAAVAPTPAASPADAQAPAPLGWTWPREQLPLRITRRRTGEGIELFVGWDVTARAVAIAETHVDLELGVDRLQMRFQPTGAALIDVDTARADSIGPTRFVRELVGTRALLRVHRYSGQVLSTLRPLPRLKVPEQLRRDAFLGTAIVAIEDTFSGPGVAINANLALHAFPKTPAPPQKWQHRSRTWLLDAEIILTRSFRQLGEVGVFEGRVERIVRGNPFFQTGAATRHQEAPARGEVEPAAWRHRIELELRRAPPAKGTLKEVIELRRR